MKTMNGGLEVACGTWSMKELVIYKIDKQKGCRLLCTYLLDINWIKEKQKHSLLDGYVYAECKIFVFSFDSHFCITYIWAN